MATHSQSLNKLDKKRAKRTGKAPAPKPTQ